MKNMSFPMNNMPEQNEQVVSEARVEETRQVISPEQSQMQQLIQAGFAWDEALKLLDMQEHLYENSEMRQRVEDDPRMHFVRWLHAHGELSEDLL